MPSQKSNSASLESARAPKRQRGRLRVAAIMEAAAEVFAEKGYSAATMTEIAARADTAIGSLYRFFPSKEALADAMLARYQQLIVDALKQASEQAQGLSTLDLADRLIDFILALRRERQFVLALIDAREGGARLAFRAAMRDGVASLLQAARPDLLSERVAIMAPLVIQVLKSVTAAAENEDDPAAWLHELRRMLRAYLDASLEHG